MKKCPKCKTVFLDDSVKCPYCNANLQSDEDKKIVEPPEKGSGIFAVLIYTALFILFIMGIYYLISHLSR